MYPSYHLTSPGPMIHRADRCKHHTYKYVLVPLPHQEISAQAREKNERRAIAANKEVSPVSPDITVSEAPEPLYRTAAPHARLGIFMLPFIFSLSLSVFFFFHSRRLARQSNK